MILSIHNTLLEDIQNARKEGYVEDFMYADKKLIALNSKTEYTAAQCKLIEYCRHEGSSSDPDDASILFLIRCSDGTKGCLSSGYGRHADANLIDFVMGLQKE